MLLLSMLFSLFIGDYNESGQNFLLLVVLWWTTQGVVIIQTDRTQFVSWPQKNSSFLVEEKMISRRRKTLLHVTMKYLYIFTSNS